MDQGANTLLRTSEWKETYYVHVHVRTTNIGIGRCDGARRITTILRDGGPDQTGLGKAFITQSWRDYGTRLHVDLMVCDVSLVARVWLSACSENFSS